MVFPCVAFDEGGDVHGLADFLALLIMVGVGIDYSCR